MEECVPCLLAVQLYCSCRLIHVFNTSCHTADGSDNKGVSVGARHVLRASHFWTVVFVSYEERHLQKTVSQDAADPWRWPSRSDGLRSASRTLYCIVLMLSAPVPLYAQSPPNVAQPAPPVAATSTAAATPFTIELNKLEPFDKGCRLYFVSDNESERTFQSYKLDLYLFQPDGVVGPHVGVDLGPLKAAKRAVKMFPVENVTCEKIGSVLINDVSECKADPQPNGDCLSSVVLKSLAAGVTLKK